MQTDSENIPLFMILIGATLILNAVIVLCHVAFSTVNRNMILDGENGNGDKKLNNAKNVLKKPFIYRYTDRMLNYAFIITGAVLTILLPYNDIISLAIYFISILLFSEILPRKLATIHCEKITREMALFQIIVLVIFSPIVRIIAFVADLILRIFRQDPNAEINRFSEEQVMSLLEAGQKSGEIKEEGRKMIHSIFEFDDELAYEIMTPRTDVFLIDLEDPQEEYIDELMELKYSRIPVCEGEPDNIIGILHIKDYLIKARTEGFENINIREIMRTPYFVPETKNIDALFFELQKEKKHIAVLIDEYGGFSGIVTLEDIIEEVMGDIDDEFDEEETSIEKLDDNKFIVNGKEYLDDLNESLGLSLHSDNSETIGGLMIDLLGEIPANAAEAESVRCENCMLKILSVKERRIENVQLEILENLDEDSDGNSQEK